MHDFVRAEVRELMQAARGYLAHPRDWCQGHEAQDRDGVRVSPWHASAARLSIEGALHRAHAAKRWSLGVCTLAEQVLARIIRNDHPEHWLDRERDAAVLVKWNDGIYGPVDHAKVRALLARGMEQVGR